MHRISALLIISFFNCLVAICQPQAFDPQESLQNVGITQWTADDGLSSNNTTSVFQDSKGLIWITSFNGFMIYDGERFEVYDRNNLDILETDGFLTVVESQDGVIYLGSQGSGIIRYVSGRFELLKTSGDELPKSIRSMYVSADGTIYAGTNNKGLYRIFEDSVVRFNHKVIEQATIMSIAEDDNGRLWLGTEGDGLFGIMENESIHYSTENGLISNNIKWLEKEPNGSVYVGTTQGLQFISRSGELETVEQIENTYINCLMFDQWNSLWIGTEKGIARWNQQYETLDWIYSKRGIDLVRISDMVIDRENNIWVTSNRSGLVRIEESFVSNITHPSISSDRVYIVHESWDGRFYIGTDQNQIDVCDDNSCQSIKIKTGLFGNGVRDIFHDRDGSLWLATYVGIIHLNDGKETVYSTATGMPANNFRTVLKGRNGCFWFGSRSGGLVKFKEGEIVRVFSNNNGLESDFVLAVSEAENGDIYVGTHSGGMTIIDTQDSSKTYHVRKDDSGIILFNIDLEADRKAIVTANIGPIYFDGDSLKIVKLVSDQRSKSYFDIISDDQNHLWLTTNIGVLIIQKSDWQKYLKNEISEISYTIVNGNNGMNNPECTGATRSIKSLNGKIYVPTLGGVCTIDPKDLKQNTQVPEVIIRHAIVDNIPLYLFDSIIQVPPGSVRYNFKFSVLSYTSPEENQYRYKLAGLDKDWSPAGYDGMVEYTNLAPGYYTFSVMGSNNNQIWNEQGDSFSFTVLPFFYETVWFYLLLLAGIMVILLLVYRWRVSFINRQNMELKKVNAELDRFVYSASHEMRSPLASILGLVNVAKMDESGDKNQYYDMIEKSVRKLDGFIHDIIDYSRNSRLGLEVEPIELEPMIHDILNGISYTENFDKIVCSVSNQYKKTFHSDPKRLKVALSNIITNAFKHHAPDKVDHPQVNISLSETKTGVKIEIKDNGPGIEEEHIKNLFKMFYRATTRSEGSGLGLYIVDEIITKMNGKLVLKSKPGEGTSFSIQLPDLSNGQSSHASNH